MRLSRIVNFVVLGLLGLLIARFVLALLPFTAIAARSGGSAAGMVVAMMLLAMPVGWCAKAFDEGRMRRAMAFGIALGLFAGLAWIAVAIMAADHRDHPWLSTMVIVGSWATAGTSGLGFMALMIRQRQPLLVGRIVRVVAVGLVALALVQGALAVTAFQLGWPAWDGPPPDSGDAAPPIRILMATGVLAGGALIASLVLAALSHADGPVPAHRRFEVGIRCPRCGHAQRIRSGGDVCGACGLRIAVEAA